MKLTGKRVALGALIIVVGAFIVQKALFPSDEAQIRRTIERVATSEDPAVCEEGATDTYLEQITGDRRPFADEVCEVEAERRREKEVRVEEVEVDGDRATATVVYPERGVAVRAALVEEEGDWRLDRRLSVEDLNRPAFRAAFREEMEDLGTSPALVRCYLGREARLSDRRLRAAVLGRGDDPFVAIGIACERERAERSVLSALGEAGLAEAGMTCAERRLDAAPPAFLARLQLSLAAYGRFLHACDADALRSYGRTLREEGRDADEVDCVVEALTSLPPAAGFRLTYADDRYAALVERCREA